MRYLELDFIRGIAIILMVVFHTSYDLNYFHFINIDIYNHHSSFWHNLRTIILTLFLGTMGISLSLAYEFTYNLKKILRQAFSLFVSALSISLVSYLMFPKYYIYFGILHFIFLSFILALPFVRYHYVSLISGIFIIFFSYIDIINVNPIYNYLQPILSLPAKTKDLMHFFPWFGVVLVGIFIGKKRLFTFNLIKNSLTKKITFLGKHSLVIYLMHQPLLYGFFMLLYYFLQN